jgi:hypothetical protein
VRIAFLPLKCAVWSSVTTRRETHGCSPQDSRRLLCLVLLRHYSLRSQDLPQRVLGCDLAFSAVRRLVLMRSGLASISIPGDLISIMFELPDQNAQAFLV